MDRRKQETNVVADALQILHIRTPLQTLFVHIMLNKPNVRFTVRNNALHSVDLGIKYDISSGSHFC